MWLTYNNALELMVGNTPLPDPSSWKYQVADLDTGGSRDGTGYLHRAYVATKINYEFNWNALEWEMLDRILNAVQSPKFRFTGPDPRNMRKTYTGDYYVGDRTGECLYYRPGSQEGAVYSLGLKFIEF